MALNLVSPGVKVREVDLTIGRIDDVTDQVGAIAGPFAKGPVNVPILVETEQDLLATFGKPYSTDDQYEYWMTASSFLSYGGVLRVVRSSNKDLSNANAPVGLAQTNLQVNSTEDYYNNHTTDSEWLYAARNPGSWANDLKICVIDGRADQRLAIGTEGIQPGFAITAGFSTSIARLDGTVGVETGYLKGVITDVHEGSVDVKVLSKYVDGESKWYEVDYEEGSSTGAFLGYDQGVLDHVAGLAYSYSTNHANLYRVFDANGDQIRLERTRFQAAVGVGSTVIDFSSDLDTSKVSIGDQVRSLN